jgi:hypothetical protein
MEGKVDKVGYRSILCCGALEARRIPMESQSLCGQ